MVPATMWSLRNIHQIGELFAAFAVVLSLLFVGYEVRQNNLTQIRNATQEVLRDY